VIAAIREEDDRLNEISEAPSTNHIEDIRKSLSVVRRGGSLAWPGGTNPSNLVMQTKADLEEDFHHLLDQTDLVWKNREKKAAVRRRHRDDRTTALTNAFAYLYARPKPKPKPPARSILPIGLITETRRIMETASHH
jgi:hypothetical protein